MENSQILVEATNLVRDYGRGSGIVHALRGIDLTIERGKFTAIMGPSGSGKSTLLHVLTGLDELTSGSVTLEGHLLQKMSDNELTLLRRSHIGFVFQSFNLLPMFTAEQNITLPAVLAGTKIDQEWFRTLVEMLGIKDRLKHRPSELSGGQQQRVAIARALIMKPSIVFADEPTGNLDTESSRQVLDFFASSVERFNQSIVMVTHDPQAASRADRVIMVTDGKISADLNHPQVEELAELLANTSSAVNEAQSSHQSHQKVQAAEDESYSLPMMNGQVR